MSRSSIISANGAGCFEVVISDSWRRGARDSVRGKRVSPRCVCFSVVTKVVDGSDRFVRRAALDDAIHGGCESLGLKRVMLRLLRWVGS